MTRAYSLRVRMIVLFCAVVGVLLAGSYAGLYILLSRGIRAEFDRRLLESAAPVAADEATDADTQDVAELNLPNQYFEVLDGAGAVLALSKNLEGRPLDLTRARGASAVGNVMDLDDGARGRLRLVKVPFVQQGAARILLLAIPTRERDATLASFRRVLLVLLPCSLLLMALVAAWYVGRSLRPVTELTQHADWMTAHLREPAAVPVSPALETLPQSSAGDELGRLAAAFKQLFVSTEAALGQLRQFVADASHELRTPLSILQGETELVLSQTRSPEEYRKALQVIQEELRKLSRIVEGLFTLAMADAGQLRLARQPLYLNEVLEEACAFASQHARAKNIAIERALDREVPYEGDEAFLRQTFLILLENAVKYSPANTRVAVRLERSNGNLRVEFRDQGIGIAAEHLPHVFERFFRAAQAGNGESQSGGLGLAIADAIVRAHGGAIRCSSAPGAGSSFTIELPASNGANPGG